jgi:putative oxidoreductase
MSRPSLASRWTTWSPQLQSVLRIVAAFIFMQSGTMKLFAFPMGVPPNGGTVTLMSQMGLAGILEVFGGFLLLVGLFTRPIAFLLAGEMAVAYFQVHFPQGFWPVMNGGVTAALYSFVWLFFSAAGPGPWSVDAWLKNRREKTARVPRREQRPIEVGPGHGGRLPA